MDYIKILHSSDLHFDTAFAELSGDKAAQRREDLRETFGKIIEEVKKEKIQIVLLAGDIFDNGTVMPETISYLLKKFNEISETKVFISAGNHDPLEINSYYKIIEWPDNVHIFDSCLEKVDIDELNTSVYGISFSDKYEKEPLVGEFFVEDPSRINILLLHGEVDNEKSIYNSINIQNFSESGLDYIALGHIHSFSGINRVGNALWSYSGTPEGRGFDELGEKGIILGEIGKDKNNLYFKKIAKREYVVSRVDITKCENYEDIILKINETIGFHDLSIDLEKLRKNTLKNLYKIILEGTVNKDFIINTQIIKDKLEGNFYFIKIVDETELEEDYQLLQQEYSIKGIFVKKLLDRLRDCSEEKEKEKIKIALKAGIAALDQRGV